MAEAQAAAAPKKERVSQVVKMSDGRDVEFVGTRRVLKATVLDESKIQLDEAGGMLVLQTGAVSVRMDFINGQTRLLPLPLSLICDFAGHGGEQKFGDTLASPKEKPLSPDDMVIAIDELAEVIAQGKWSQRAESDGFSGASIVIKAFMEATGKPQDAIKKFLNDKLEAAKLRGEKLSRADLYRSFKNPDSKIGKIIARLEREELSKSAKVDADETLAEFEAQAA